jgi:acetyl-CoA C-acetyltransferase
VTTAAGITPVIAGIGQVANKDDGRMVHPITLIEDAARAALDDAGIELSRIDGVLATPLTTLGSEDASEMVAHRLGITPALRSVSTFSGAAPQHLVAEACRAVSNGLLHAVLIVGGVAEASVRRARRRGLDPLATPASVWSQGSDGIRDLRPVAPVRAGYTPETASGAGMPSAFFALVDSALGAGGDPISRRTELGRLLAPFTEVAALRPHLAWFPRPRSGLEIALPTEDNRLVAEPYTKLMCSFPTVDLAAAVVIAPARKGSRPVVRPLSVATSKEGRPPSGWVHMNRPRALDRAVDEAVRLARISPAEISIFDLYSCFPTAVQLASNAFQLTADDPRPRTVTGGLAYFGGPGASYSLHGVVCMVEELRKQPDAVGAVVGVGGMVTDFSVGLYSTSEGPFASIDLGEGTYRPVDVRPFGKGRALVEAMTVLHDRDRGPVAAPVIARLADGSRTGARPADPQLPAALSGTSLVGQEVELTMDNGKVSYVPF